MADEKKKQEPKRKRFFIAEKVEVTTKRGQLKGGKEVYPKDFPGGQGRINELVTSKALVEK